jgi:hypothetical protein
MPVLGWRELAVGGAVRHLSLMTLLSDSDRLFVDERRARRRTGLYVLPALLVLLGLIWAALFLWWPLAINPNAVLGAAEMGIISCGSGALSRYALSATVLVNVLLLLLAIFCAIAIARAGRERRYLRIIDRLAKESVEAPGATAAVRQ